MRGNPVLRIVFLAILLGGTGLLVARVAGWFEPPKEPSDPGMRRSGTSDHPAEAADFVVDAYAEMTLSAPARSVTLGAIGSPVFAFEVRPEGLEAEVEFPLALRNGHPIKDLLVVEWERPEQSNFLHLTIEPETLKTRETTLHFPPGESSVLLALVWPAEPKSP